MRHVCDLIVKHIAPTRWYKRARWELVEDLKIIDHVIPKGFITDGASVPLVLIMIFSPTGKYMKAAVVHDYLLEQLESGESRKVPDNEFYKVMTHLDVPAWRKVSMFSFVRSYGVFINLFK